MNNKPASVIERDVILNDGSTFTGIEGTYVLEWHPDQVGELALDDYEACSDICGVAQSCEMNEGGRRLSISALVNLFLFLETSPLGQLDPLKELLEKVTK